MRAARNVALNAEVFDGHDVTAGELGVRRNGRPSRARAPGSDELLQYITESGVEHDVLAVAQQREQLRDPWFDDFTGCRVFERHRDAKDLRRATDRRVADERRY